MLCINIPDIEFYNEEIEEFFYYKGENLQLEHSLVSLSKWESKWHKPFLGKEQKTTAETIDYIRCMTINKNVDPNIYDYIPDKTFNLIIDYVDDSMTATWFTDLPGQKKNREVVTAEIIYYWMISLSIPSEYEKWHLNRLLTLIRVCNEKNKPPKKMGRKEMLAQRHALNQARRAKLNSKG